MINVSERLKNVRTLNINNLKATPNNAFAVDDRRFIEEANSLEKIYLNEVYALGVICGYLPNRTGKTAGKIITPIRHEIEKNADLMSVLTERNWEVVDIIAQYRFNPDVYENLLPIFGDSFTSSEYNVIDKEHDITLTNMYWEKGIIAGDGSNATDSNYANAVRSGYISVTGSLTYAFDIDYCQVYWYNKNKECIYASGLYGTNSGVSNGNKCVAPPDARFVRIYRGAGTPSSCSISTRYIDRIIESKNGLTPNYIKFGGETWNSYGDAQTALLQVHACRLFNMTSSYGLFSNCRKLTRVAIPFAVLNGNMSQMFYGCYKLIDLDVSTWNTSNVTIMQGMFQECSSLTRLDVSNWNTSKVEDMDKMFKLCSKLTEITGIGNWNTSKVTNMHRMFRNCNSLTTLDVSNWDTGKVTNMQWMFYQCPELRTLDVSKWNTGKVTDMSHMFNGCSGLK